MPAPSKFTPIRKKALLKLIENSTPIGTACDQTGIDRTTFYLWKRKSDQYNPDVKESEEFKSYAEFFKRVYKAKAQSLIKILALITECGIGYKVEEVVEEYLIKGDGEIDGLRKVKKTQKIVRHPGCLLFLAERLFPATLGNKMKIDIEGIDDLILREILRLTNKSESSVAAGVAQKDLEVKSDGLAQDQSSEEPENWETL